MCFEIKDNEVKEILKGITTEEVKDMDISEKMFYITTLIKVSKDTTNNHAGFSYSSLSAIKTGLNPLALKFRVRFKIEKFKQSVNDKGVKMWEGIIHAINVDDKEDIDSLTLEIPQKTLASGGMGETESTGATFTYLTRYLYRTILNISDGDDIDNFSGKKDTTTNPKEQKEDPKKIFIKELEELDVNVQNVILEGFKDKFENQIKLKNALYLKREDFKIAQERLDKIKVEEKDKFYEIAKKLLGEKGATKLTNKFIEKFGEEEYSDKLLKITEEYKKPLIEFTIGEACDLTKKYSL